MKEIILKRLKLSNWKAKNLDVSFNEGATTISAQNEVGKSSLQHAWNWLFTSYTTPTAARNSNLYDKRVLLSPDTPDASVKAWVLIDGAEYTLERIAQPKFKRPRGSNEWVKDSSDNYIIKIDDFDVTATAFSEWVESMICPLDKIAYLLDGAFFTALALEDKKKARAIIDGIVGGCDMAELKGDYSKLSSLLAKHTAEDVRNHIAAQMLPIKKRIDAIPAIINNKLFVVNDLEKRYNADRISDKVSELSSNILASPNKETISALVIACKALGVAEYAKVEREGMDLLRKEQREMANSLVELEGDKALADALLEERAQIVGGKINKLLDGCKVQMFSTQINGANIADCVITDDEGVNFATLSTSARLRVNLAIQNLFKKHYGVSIITWIDEAAVFDKTHLPKPDGQVCYLYAGDSDTLVVE